MSTSMLGIMSNSKGIGVVGFATAIMRNMITTIQVIIETKTEIAIIVR